MRISGFASGMDIDSMVRDLMKAESIPLQNMQKEKQELEWKRDDYRSINTLLLDFKDSLLNMRMTTAYRSRQVTSSNEDFITAIASSAANQTSYTISKVGQLATASTKVNNGSISDPNKEVDTSKGLYGQTGNFADNPLQENVWKQGIIEKKDLTADSLNQDLSLNTGLKVEEDMKAISIKVNGKGFEVLTEKPAEGVKLADNQVVVDKSSGDLTFAEGVIQKGTKISAEYIVESKTESRTVPEGGKTLQLSAGSIAVNDSFNLIIDEKNYKISDSTGNENEYNLKNSENGDVIGVINTETGKITFNDAVEKETNVQATYQQNYTHFSLNAHTEDGKQFGDFIVAGNESINQVVSEVNKANIGVSMLYDSFKDQFTLRTTETGNFVGNKEGEPRKDQIETNGTLINELFRFGGVEETGGQNATFTINGLDTERYSNTFDIEGVTFTLKQTFDSTSDTDADQPVSLNISNNSEEVFDNIKEFVETYNTLIDAINDKVTETFYRDYDPLTDDQREGLTDKQQEDWEERAKSGLLRNDAILRDVLSSMRTGFYSPVNNDQSSSGSFNQLAAIGITTTKDYMSGGKLEINEAKLKEAIEQDPDAVENLFRGGSDSDTYGEKGIARRLTDTVDAAMNKIYERAGRASYSNHQFTLGRNLDDMDKQIERFEDRLTQIEDRYWKQFTAMEQAIAKYNNQASYMMQQFGGMQ
ncbi:flagellar filament capping protein FliD [Gracilibacillus oryzae]|uniref:Flagellar hook-associated protein 2 n=2 Tax=Gracilibacillus oryzae TaxID=1672701 RepID=A0A7C8GTF9_9BACI|nr:flagellar filament capping protein FliD [Gracilibacillus oryzae]